MLRQSLDQIGKTIQDRGAELVDAVLSSAMGIVNIALLFVIVPVVTFYLLWDWDRMVAAIDDLLPRDHAPVIRDLASQIDRTLAGSSGARHRLPDPRHLLRGRPDARRASVRTDRGGGRGALTFIPYIGALVGGALAIGLALFQFWGEWWHIAIVAGIFMVGQFFEGNILTPNLVGTSVGLHPVWLIFALSAFGTVFGFVGMLVAVPVAAALGVVTRYLIQRYKEGRLYKGLSEGRCCRKIRTTPDMAHQLTFDLPVRTSRDRGDFFIADSNAVALAAIERWKDWPSAKMVLTGPDGSGKAIWSRSGRP